MSPRWIVRSKNEQDRVWFEAFLRDEWGGVR
jgi:hypothetical protein